MQALSVFVPVYNEEDLLVPHADRLVAYLSTLGVAYELIIGSNGSDDDTPRLGRELQKKNAGIRFFHLPRKGPGTALRQAVALMRYEAVICMDLDLSVDPEFIGKSLALLDECDIVIGAKKLGVENRSLPRRLGSDAFIACSKRLLGLPFDDYSIGAKAYRKSVLRRYLSELDADTAYVQKLIFRAFRDGLTVTQIPTVCNDLRRSRFDIKREGLYRFGELFKLAWRRRLGKVGLAAALVLGCAAAPRAGVISLETQSRVKVEGTTLAIDLTMTNRGTEPAYGVQAKIQGREISAESPIREVLPVSAAQTARFRIPLRGDAAPGSYPLFVRILYADANHYPFSALSASRFYRRQDASAEVLAVLGEARLSDRGRLSLRIKNLEAVAKRVSLALVLPRELTAEAEALTLDLLPQQETSVPFRIKNFSALQGSVYPVFASIEYDQGGLHHTALAGGTVRIEAARGLREVMMWIALALLAAFVLFNVRTSRPRR